MDPSATREFLARLEESVSKLPLEDTLTLIGELERLKVRLTAQVMGGGKDGGSGDQGQGQLLTVAEVSGKLKITEQYAYEMLRRGELPSVQVGPKYIRVPLSGLLEWEAKRTMNGAAAIPNSRG